MSGDQRGTVSRWDHCIATESFPDNMIQAGVDRDGALIYVGRASHEGDVLPAKVIPSKKASYVCYAGTEIKKENFEVLRYGEYEWKYASNGSVPKTAMKIGQTCHGEPLYMGRAICSGSQTPGKVHSSHGCCYLPFNGKEVRVYEYDVLCTK